MYAVCVMARLEVNILRDQARNPSIVNLVKDGRKLQVTYDGDNIKFEGDQSLFPSVPDVLQMAYPYELEANARPQWYDRNVKNYSGLYNGVNVAPHAGTDRLTYTCPENKNARFYSIQLGIQRATAAAPVGRVLIYGTYTPYLGTPYGVYNLNLGIGNNVGDRADCVLPVIHLWNGDKFKWVTMDTSTGGTCCYQINYMIAEYDA